MLRISANFLSEFLALMVAEIPVEMYTAAFQVLEINKGWIVLFSFALSISAGHFR